MILFVCCVGCRQCYRLRWQSASCYKALYKSDYDCIEIVDKCVCVRACVCVCVCVCVQGVIVGSGVDWSEDEQLRDLLVSLGHTFPWEH